MSKKELRSYLEGLTKRQLEDQLMDLYTRFKEVKTFYDFTFQPKENKLLEEARFKITKEYFPLSGRKPKARRSVAQKIIRHFIQLGVDPHVIADVMLYNVEIAQQFSRERQVKQEAFYKSILKSYQEAARFVGDHRLQVEFGKRLQAVVRESKSQHWMNLWGFEDALYELMGEQDPSDTSTSTATDAG